jgi:hypothetical protein
VKRKAGPDRAPEATSLVPWPLLRIARHLYGHASPDLLLFFAEALEEAANHAEAVSLATNPCARGMRDLAADVRARAPARDDTNPSLEAA